jgi:hypothetical protein
MATPAEPAVPQVPCQQDTAERTDAMKTHWVIDWRRINSIEDIKALLMACELQPQPSHPSFELLKPFCKKIDDDGREVPESETATAP